MSRYFEFRELVGLDPEVDHLRLDRDGEGAWVEKSGAERPSDLRFYEVEQVIEMDAAREVNAKSSDSLRRSHRYAEVYGKGKLAGAKQIRDEAADTIRTVLEDIGDALFVGNVDAAFGTINGVLDVIDEYEQNGSDDSLVNDDGYRSIAVA
jgi:hypothetical protein